MMPGRKLQLFPLQMKFSSRNGHPAQGHKFKTTDRGDDARKKISAVPFADGIFFPQWASSVGT